MIKKTEISTNIERFESYISTEKGLRYEFKWWSNILHYLTCSLEGVEIKCQELIHDSIDIIPFSAGEQNHSKISLDLFNEIHPTEQIDLTSNCHGFTFAQGYYTIASEYVDQILREEYLPATPEQVEAMNFDVVVFRNGRNEPIHSCRYHDKKFLHKEGMRKFRSNESVQEILSQNEYAQIRADYYRLKPADCPGICFRAIGKN